VRWVYGILRLCVGRQSWEVARGRDGRRRNKNKRKSMVADTGVGGQFIKQVMTDTLARAKAPSEAANNSRGG